MVQRFYLARTAPLFSWLMLAILLCAYRFHTLPVAVSWLFFGWSFFLDGPHVAASLLRLSYWTDRGKKIKALGFATGLVTISLLLLFIGGADFFISCFFALSYWHICSQHLGFFKILSRIESGQSAVALGSFRRLLAINLWAPFVLRIFVLDPWGGIPLPHLSALPSDSSLTWTILFLLAGLQTTIIIFSVIAWNRQYLSRNQALYLAGIAPVQAFTLFAPLSPYVAIMILSAGHGLQYLEFSFLWRKSASAKFSEIHALGFLIFGILFTSVFLRGEFYDWWTSKMPMYFAYLGMFITVFHYALDSRMWKISEDRSLELTFS